MRDEQLIQQDSSCVNEDPRMPKVSLVSSMIYDLQREDTFTGKTVTSTFQRKGDSQRWNESRLERQVISTNVSVSVFQSKCQERKVQNDQDKVRKMGLDTMKRNCDLLLTGIGGTGQAKAKGKELVTEKRLKDQSKYSDNDLKVDTNGPIADEGSIQHSKKSKLIEETDSETRTACCFQWQPSISHNKVKNTSTKAKAKDLSELEKNQRQETAEDETEVHVRNGEKEKVSLLVRLKSKLTKRKILAVMCPCFTYLILKGETKEKVADDGKRQDYIHRQEMRDGRFERDMQMSQTFCVLISQLLFMLGADAKDYKIACAVVAITMNYLSLVTLCWLIVQALYLFNFTRARESEEKQYMKIKLYFAGAWGLPLFAVFFLVSKYETYHKHPHCWISFADISSWSVATPMITLGMVQVILIILLAKALVTYRKSDSTVENEYKKSIIKSGIQTVVCITVSVVLTWLLGSLSLNIDRGVYHTFFSIFNAMQGVAFFLFYVLLNAEVRQLILSAWEWKNSSVVTPFDDHEAIEIEEEKDKDKKKGKNEPVGKENNAKDEKQTKQENKPNEIGLTTIQKVPEAKKAASSLATNTKTNNKGNASGAKSDVQGKIRKYEDLTYTTSENGSPRKLPSIEPNKKTTSTIKAAEQKRKKFVEDPLPKQKIADAPTSPNNKKPRLPALGSHPLRTPAPAGKKKMGQSLK